MNAASAKLVLLPTGDRSLDHLGPQAVADVGVIELSAGVFEVGRSPPADIVISIPTVSGRHAMVSVDEETKIVKVTDLGSTNGTFINGLELREMQSGEVAVGDEVTFGDPHVAMFVLQEMEDTPESAAPADAA